MAKFSVIPVTALLVCLVVVVSDATKLVTDVSDYSCLPCDVELIYAPVCGSDGRSYVNIETMRCDAKCLHREIKLQHLGKCREDSFDVHVEENKNNGCVCP